MKPGQAYEDFVYERARKLFSNAVVSKRAHKPGRQSGLSREIDVLVEAPPEHPGDVFIILSCKDYKNHRANITTLGEFASVIRDVGAAAGWLLCTSGFAKSNYQYAKTLGIQLVTIKDISSDVWTSTAQLPVVVKKYEIIFRYTISVEATAELVELNRKPLTIPVIQNETRVRITERQPLTLLQWAQEQVQQSDFSVRDGGTFAVQKPNFEVELLPQVWAPATVDQLIFEVSSRKFVKEFPFAEYIELHDHVRDFRFPIRGKADFSFDVDESWKEVDPAAYSDYAGMIIEVENWPA